MKVDSLFRDISVVIPTFNRPKTLQSTIESYLSGNALPKQIIVVDQSQYPFDPYFISNWRGVEIKVIHQPIPSLTLARNIGARTSDCDVILFSDDDVLVNVDSISILTDVMDDKSYALVAGVDIDENGVWGSPQKRGMLKEAASMILGLKKPWRKDGYVIRSNMRGRYPVPVMQRVSTEWAMGYFFCVRRSLMERWNIWFDEGMDRYAYAEDLDFSIRYCLMAQQERLNCVLEPKIYVDHLASNEWRTPSEEAVRYFVRNRRRIAHKVYPNRWWYPITMNCFDTLFAIIKMPSDFEYSSYLLKSIYSKSGRISDKAN